MTQSLLLSFDKAKDKVLQASQKLIIKQNETIYLTQAKHHILSDSIVSTINVPSFDQSAMDGYAFRLNEIELGKENRFSICAAVFAGDDKSIHWKKNTALRVMTGAPLPKEADLVLMQEDVVIQGNEIIFTPKNIKQGMNIRYAGENVKKGSVLFKKNEAMTLPKLTTLAALGMDQIQVYAPLKVAIFSTGNELVSVGAPLMHAHQIYDTNRFMLQQYLTSLQCEVLDLGILPDDLNCIKSALLEASLKVDLIITSGGVSVGDADFTKQALIELGQIEFWKIAMKPGKPFAFGEINQTLFCGLPGNPVSAMITFYQLVKPAIELAQHKTESTKLLKAKTTSFLKKRAGRVDFQRGILTYDEEARIWQVTTSGKQESHLTTSFHDSNCFIILEQDRENVEAGEWVTVQPFDAILM